MQQVSDINEALAKHHMPSVLLHLPQYVCPRCERPGKRAYARAVCEACIGVAVRKRIPIDRQKKTRWVGAV